MKALCEVVERAIVKGLDTKKKEGKVGEMEGVNHFSMLEHGRYEWLKVRMGVFHFSYLFFFTAGLGLLRLC